MADELAEVAEVASPIGATVIRIERGVGDRVVPETTMALLDTDGVRIEVRANVTGIVQEVGTIDVGQTVETGDVLFVVAVTAPEQPTEPGAGAALDCMRCGAEGLEPGFLQDAGAGAAGFARWIEGPLDMGWLGGARSWGRTRREVHAYRCPECHHLEFFAGDEA